MYCCVIFPYPATIIKRERSGFICRFWTQYPRSTIASACAIFARGGERLLPALRVPVRVEDQIPEWLDPVPH
jgi:hypothetical protein